MTVSDLEQYLHGHIPLSKAMQVSVVSIHLDSVVVSAPLEPNINHRHTVFGGSESAIAILAAWSLLHTRLTGAGSTCRLVIRRNTMEYTAPILGAFTAKATLANEADWQPFAERLERKGKARIDVVSVIEFEGEVAGRLEGEFVALTLEPTDLQASS